jgi:hypothetical protein
MVGRTGLEPVTPALSRRCSNQLSYMPNGFGGDKETRTPDIKLAKLALYQLSYTPIFQRYLFFFLLIANLCAAMRLFLLYFR